MFRCSNRQRDKEALAVENPHTKLERNNSAQSRCSGSYRELVKDNKNNKKVTFTPKLGANPKEPEPSQSVSKGALIINVKVREFDTTFPIDLQDALQQFEQNKLELYTMIRRLEPSGFGPHMYKMAFAVEQKDFLTLKEIAHQIKGNCGWVSASKLHYAAYYIQKAWHEQDTLEMLARYPQVVEAAIEFKRYALTVCNKLIDKHHPETDQTSNVAFAAGYQVLYCSDDNYYYCVKSDQTLEERKIQLAQMELKPPNVNENSPSKQVSNNSQGQGAGKPADLQI